MSEDDKRALELINIFKDAEAPEFQGELKGYDMDEKKNTNQVNEDDQMTWDQYLEWSKKHTQENLKRMDERMKALEKRIEERIKNSKEK